MTDIRNNPAEYLTGPPPLNVTGYNVHCNPQNTSVCKFYNLFPTPFLGNDLS